LGDFFYLFNPAVLPIPPFGGRSISLTILFALAAVYFFESRPWLSAFLFGFGHFGQSPSRVGGFTDFIFYLFGQKGSGRRFFPYALLSFSVFTLTFLPFAGSVKNLLPFAVERLKVSLSQYPYLSVNAFNFWALGGFWRPDQGVFRPSLLVAFLPLLDFNFLS